MLIEKTFPIDAIKDEFRVWNQFASPQLILTKNVENICSHGFTEILNNVIDHSTCSSVGIKVQQDAKTTSFEIKDDGVGIFEKLIKHFNLDSDTHAAIELIKGKLTVDPEAHSGEGLFFSSKMFDKFEIESGTLKLSFEDNKCFVSRVEFRQGTVIRMVIDNNATITAREVFDRYSDLEELNFCKTKFFVSLSEFEGNLISRSQAKRIVSRLENFSEAEIDFYGVDSIGQAFADELFRVWRINNPNTKLIVKNASEDVKKMIKHVESRLDLPQPVSDKAEPSSYSP